MLAGLLTAFLALGVAQLVAGISRPQGSPVAAVGSLAIDHTPPAVKNFAIATFGSHDKTALVTGILVVLAILAAGIGVAAMRRLGYGLLGLAGFAVIGLLAALTRPNAEAVDVLPTLIGVAAGAFTLAQLVRAAGRGTAAPAPGGPAMTGPPPPGAAQARMTGCRAAPALMPPARASLPARASRPGHRPGRRYRCAAARRGRAAGARTSSRRDGGPSWPPEPLPWP